MSFGTPFFQGNNIAYPFTFLRKIPYQKYLAQAAAPVPFFGRYRWEWATVRLQPRGHRLGTPERDPLGSSGRFPVPVLGGLLDQHHRSPTTGSSDEHQHQLRADHPMQSWADPLASSKKVHEKLLASVKRPYRVSTSTTGFSETQLFLDPQRRATRS